MINILTPEERMHLEDDMQRRPLSLVDDLCLFATIDALAEALRASIAQREAMLAQNWLMPETGSMLTTANIREHNATTRVAAWLAAEDA